MKKLLQLLNNKRITTNRIITIKKICGYDEYVQLIYQL